MALKKQGSRAVRFDAPQASSSPSVLEAGSEGSGQSETPFGRWLLVSVIAALVAVNSWHVFSHPSVLSAITAHVGTYGTTIQSYIRRMPSGSDVCLPLFEHDVSRTSNIAQHLSNLVEAEVHRRLSELWGDSAMRPNSRDFALHADGGVVVCSLTTGCYSWPFHFSLSTPTLAISDSMQIGQCWTLHSHSGQLGIILSSPIVPSHVTIDHIHHNIAADIGQAPRSMILWGVVDGDHNSQAMREIPLSDIPILPTVGPRLASGYNYLPLAVFDFDITRTDTAQVFGVFGYVQDRGMDFNVVVLDILDNWGAETTCLYRVRVHGERVGEGRR